MFGTVHFAEAVVNATLKLEPGQYCTENFSVQVLWQEAEIKLEFFHSIIPHSSAFNRPGKLFLSILLAFKHSKTYCLSEF